MRKPTTSAATAPRSADALIAFLRAQGYYRRGRLGSCRAARLARLSRRTAAEFLLINLEDLWLEPAPQNVPGTWQERPNWQRKARLLPRGYAQPTAPSVTFCRQSATSVPG